MRKAGVELVVEGLMKFGRDMESANGILKQFGSNGTLLTRTFEGVGNSIKSFGGHVLDVVKIALGVLLRDAINATIQKIKELIGTAVDAGTEFQLLNLRLNRLNFNSAIESGGDYRTAMNAATDATREQLAWIQKLAVQTPYDATDIANVFTLARSYGFADQAARELIVSVTDFAAGMGLGNVEMVRILKNFGQMEQLGKIMQRDLNDLAVGAFVPVNTVLERMNENMGISNEQWKEMAKRGVTTEVILEKMRRNLGLTADEFKEMTESGKIATNQVDGFMQAFKDVVALSGSVNVTISEDDGKL